MGAIGKGEGTVLVVTVIVGEARIPVTVTVGGGTGAPD